MKSPTDRNFISPGNYEFYFYELLVVLTKELLKTNWLNSTSAVFGINSTAIMMYNHMNPGTTVRAAVLMLAGASTMLNRTNTLVNYGYVYDKDNQSEHLNEEKIKLNRGESVPPVAFSQTSLIPFPGCMKSHSE